MEGLSRCAERIAQLNYFRWVRTCSSFRSPERGDQQMTTVTSRSVLALALTLVCTGALAARTITISADECDRMGVISATAPRIGWSNEIGTNMYHTYAQLHLYSNMAILIRYPLDRIPKGQRITKAEWTVPFTYTAGVKQRLAVRRLLAEWGTGVCHDFRMVLPKKKQEWARPGGLGNADRVAKTTAVFMMLNSGQQTVDVTEDVELWYTGAAPNRGWILNLDDPGTAIFMPSPYPTGADWKLQITFEPK
jgi:hypothetical protein